MGHEADEAVIKMTTPTGQTGTAAEPLGSQNSVGVSSISVSGLAPEIKTSRQPDRP